MPGREAWSLVKVPFPYANRPAQQRRPALVAAAPDDPGAPQGRCGTLFACERCNIEPGMLALSNHLLAHAARRGADDGGDLSGDGGRVGKARHARPRLHRQRPPCGDAVASESLDIFEERGLIAQGARVGGVRGVGLIGAVELVAGKATKAEFDPPGKAGLHLRDQARENGLVVRAI